MTEDEIRKRFEAWISSEPYCQKVDRYPHDPYYSWPDQYITIEVDMAWEAWREAWKQAIGEQSVESE